MGTSLLAVSTDFSACSARRHSLPGHGHAGTDDRILGEGSKW